jgi:dipeptidyl aminopeptidase/acylaminoacyl peptidase
MNFRRKWGRKWGRDEFQIPTFIPTPTTWLCAFLLLLALSFVGEAQQRDASDDILPGDNLIVEGIPPIPRALAERVNRYTEVRSAGFQSWHPTRREMLIVTRFADVPQVHHVAMPGGARRQLTFLTERVAAASYRPKAGDSFVYAQDVGGGEWFQLYRYDVETGESTLLTDGKSRNTGAVWRDDGQMIAYMSTRRTGRDNDLYVMNPADPDSDRRLLQLQGGGWGATSWSPDGNQLALLEYRSINDTSLWLVDVPRGEKSLFTPQTPDGAETVAYGAAAFSKDGKGLYVTTNRDSEFGRLTYIDLASREHTLLTSHIEWDVTGFELSPDGRTIAFVTNEAGSSVLRFRDTSTGEEQAGPPLPPGVIGGMRWREGSREIGFTFSHARSSADAYSYDLATGTLERWTDSEAGGLNTEAFADAELITWTSFDGRTISGFYYRPAKRFSGKRPVIINIHGGPEAQARPGFQGRNNYYLNELGVAMIFPNVRGSSGYGKTFLSLDDGKLRMDAVKDIETLLDWVKAHPELDGDRILVTGGSYGGFMTMAVATRYNDKICCSIQVVGIANFISFLERTEGYRRDLRRAEYGDERDPGMRKFFEEISPLYHAHKITKPFFTVQGLNDPRVPAFEAEQIHATVKKNGTPVWFLMAKDEGHGFAKKRNQDFQFYATVLFVERYLLQ